MRGWVVGGRQARTAGVRDRDHRALYDRGVVAGITPDRLIDVEHSRDARCFKGIAADGRQLCSEGAVWPFDPETGRRGSMTEIEGGDALDLHHVVTHEASRCLAVTARDEVWIGDRRHRIADPAQRAHPNHLFQWCGALWVTRGALGDARPVDTPRPVEIADVVVHDGVVTPEGVWFTAVDGRLVRLDQAGRTETIDLTELDDRPAPLGWCRGLGFADGLAWVGFSRLRTTAHRSRLAWVRGALRGRQVATTHPTRLVAYDLGARRKIHEVCVEPFGLDAVFGLYFSPT
ncbi:MAG: hypothetical protein AAF602_11090 [Myxococcota bacterium]